MEESNIFYDASKRLGKNTANVYAGSFGKRDVAVKLFFVADKGAEKRFESELKALSTLESAKSNIIRYFAYGRDIKHDHVIQMAVEMCKASLDEWLKNPSCIAPATISKLEIIYQMTNGLAEVHDRRIIHRNLKPSNILIAVTDRTATVKLSDFGFSKFIMEGVSSTGISSRFSNDVWSAKEILEYIDETEVFEVVATVTSEPIKMSRATDIFALGCIIYYLATKNLGHPFGRAITEIRRNIKAGQPVIPSDETNVNYSMCNMSEDIPKGTLSLIHTMINKTRKMRPAARDILQHQIFWSNKTRLQFLVDVSNLCEKRSDARLQECLQAIQTGIGQDACKGPEGWMAVIKEPVKSHLRKVPRGNRWGYKQNDFVELVRAIRNMQNHWSQQNVVVRQHIGNPPNNFINYWLTLFPYLIHHTWTCFQVQAEELDLYFPQHYRFV